MGQGGQAKCKLFRKHTTEGQCHTFLLFVLTSKVSMYIYLPCVFSKSLTFEVPPCPLT